MAAYDGLTMLTRLRKCSNTLRPAIRCRWVTMLRGGVEKASPSIQIDTGWLSPATMASSEIDNKAITAGLRFLGSDVHTLVTKVWTSLKEAVSSAAESSCVSVVRSVTCANLTPRPPETRWTLAQP